MGETSAAPLISWSRDFHAVPEQAREARRFLARSWTAARTRTMPCSAFRTRHERDHAQ